MADSSQSEATATGGLSSPHKQTNGGGPASMTDESAAAMAAAGVGDATDGEDDVDRAIRAPRPADIDADVREMERRKRVDAIMNSRIFREELERIVEQQTANGIVQQITDMMGLCGRAGAAATAAGAGGGRGPTCVLPINDIRGVEEMAYAKGEKLLRCKLASLYRLADLHGWTASPACGLITARLAADEEQFLVNPYGLLFHEITASSLVKTDMQGDVVEQGTTNFTVNLTAFAMHAAIHAARPDIRCVIHVQTPAVVAVSALRVGIMPLTREAAVLGEVSTYSGVGARTDEERDRITRDLGPINRLLLLANRGAYCCGETIEEAFFVARNCVLACETQLKLMPLGVDNLSPMDEATRRHLYDEAHRPPDSTPRPDQPSVVEQRTGVERKWRVGGVEFEGLMRMLDNAGFRTGYVYRHPLVKGDPPRPKNDVELPPAVSSLGYLLEEEELIRQGLWKRDGRGMRPNDRTRWLNSPNVYQKVEILETGTTDPKKITKWVTENSPTHQSSTPVKIEGALQFVPKNTNPREFKRLQQQIKDYRRAEKISAGPQSHILEGVTWEEAKRIQEGAAAAGAAGGAANEHIVLMGAASKGIIQRGYQHNATMYKSPYAKNPFDCVTDDELDEYKKTVERKSRGEYTDTDYSESDCPTSSAAVGRPGIDSKRTSARSPTSGASETEEESRGHHVLRIETKHAPKPSQAEVVLSDGEHTLNGDQSDAHMSTMSQSSKDHERSMSEAMSPKKDKKKKKGLRTPSFLKKKKEKKEKAAAAGGNSSRDAV